MYHTQTAQKYYKAKILKEFGGSRSGDVLHTEHRSYILYNKYNMYIRRVVSSAASKESGVKYLMCLKRKKHTNLKYYI